MASSKEYLHFILGQLSDLEAVSYRSMMGEFILYYRCKIVGGIYDDRLLVKKTRSALELMPAAICELPCEGQKKCCWWMKLTIKSFLRSCLSQCAMNCHYQNKNERTMEYGRNRTHRKKKAKWVTRVQDAGATLTDAGLAGLRMMSSRRSISR